MSSLIANKLETDMCLVLNQFFIVCILCVSVSKLYLQRIQLFVRYSSILLFTILHTIILQATTLVDLQTTTILFTQKASSHTTD